MSQLPAEFLALIDAADSQSDVSLWRRVIEYAKRHPAIIDEPHVPYQLGIAWYHQPESPQRTENCERLLRQAISGDAGDWYAVLYLGHLLFDCGRYREALDQFLLIPDTAFVKYDQRWRDFKRLELIVCCSLRLGLAAQAGDAFERWVDCFASADDSDRLIGVHELPATLRQLAIATRT